MDNDGTILCDGIIEKVMRKPNKTHVVRVKVDNAKWRTELPVMTDIKGFILKERYPKPLRFMMLDPMPGKTAATVTTEDAFVCHCEDVDLKTILNVIGDRKFISVDELKHITRMGMGPCRGKRCVSRAKQILRGYGIEVVGESSPRAPLANQVTLGDVYQPNRKETFVFQTGNDVKKETVEVLIAGGGIAGSGAFRYFAEAGKKPVLVNYDRGSSWRCIARLQTDALREPRPRRCHLQGPRCLTCLERCLYDRQEGLPQGDLPAVEHG